MKNIITLALFLFGTSAMACPNLTGTYSCANDEGDTEIMTVTQAPNGLSTTYYVDGEVYEADGVTREFTEEDEGVVMRGTRTLTCQGAMLRFHEITDIFMGADKAGHYNILMDIQLDASNNMNLKSKGSYQYGDNKGVVDDNDTCQRL